MLKKAIFFMVILLMVGCASKPPQQMSPRELAKCAWNGNVDCKTELQHRLQARQEVATSTKSTTIIAAPQ